MTQCRPDTSALRQIGQAVSGQRSILRCLGLAINVPRTEADQRSCSTDDIRLNPNFPSLIQFALSGFIVRESDRQLRCKARRLVLRPEVNNPRTRVNVFCWQLGTTLPRSSRSVEFRAVKSGVGETSAAQPLESFFLTASFAEI